MTDATWEEFAPVDSDLIRKALAGGAFFVAPYATTAIANLTGTSATGTLQSLPAGYESLGWLAEDGVSLPRSIELSEVRAWGSKAPVRSDVKSDTSTVKVVALETNIRTISLSLGIALDALVADATTGEVTFDKAQDTPIINYRCLTIGRDSIEAGDIYVAQFFPKGRVTERGDQVMGGGDDPIKYELTFQGFYDTTEATDVRYFFAGPGWKSLKTQMGF